MPSSFKYEKDRQIPYITGAKPRVYTHLSNKISTLFLHWPKSNIILYDTNTLYLSCFKRVYLRIVLQPVKWNCLGWI